MGRVFVEIRLGDRRVSVCLSPEVTPYIPTILEQKSIGFILRVALEEDEKAWVALYERVDSCVLSPRERAISTSRQLAFRYIVPSGMGHLEIQGYVFQQCVI